MSALSCSEALVIGGGPAGCAAAIVLARHGRQVTLLEREAGAHDKVCGEFLSWEAVAMLRGLGIDPPALGAERLRRARLADADDVLDCVLPFEACSLSRRVLDEALLRQAEAAGACVLRGAAALGLQAEGRRWRVSGRRGDWRADQVFLACGKRDLRGWRRVQPDTRDLIGLKLHLRLAPASRQALQGGVELYLFRGGYGGLEGVEAGKVSLCYLIDKEHYRGLARQDPLAWLAVQAPALADRLAGAESLWPQALAVYRTPYGWLAPAETPPGLFRLGDQLGVIPSLAGDGIALALHSGLLAARSSLRGVPAAQYARQARQDFRRPIRKAAWLEAALRRRAPRHALFRLARLLPALPAWGASQVRLGKAAGEALAAADESGIYLPP